MKLPVTETGVVLPRALFGQATEVEVRQENGHISVEVIESSNSMVGQIRPYDVSDPIWQLGKKTSKISIHDASVNLDKYLYGDLGNS